MSEKPGSEHSRSLVESFFREMTVEQFQLMALCEPDGATKTLLAELLLELVACVSRAVVENLDRRLVVVREENVRSTVGDPVLFSFGALMDDEDQVPCEAVDLLRALLVEEVVKKVNTILENVLFSERIASQGIPPHRLNAMMHHTFRLFSVVRPRTAGLEPFRPSHQNNSVAASALTEDLHLTEDLQLTQDLQLTEDLQLTQDLQLPEDLQLKEDLQPGSSVDPEAASPEDDVAAAIFEIISEQADKISAPLLNNVQNWERSQLKSQTSLEIQKASDNMSHRHRSVAAEKGGGKIEILLSVHFIRALLYHIMEQINTKFHSDRSLQTLPLFSATDTLLLRVIGQGEEHMDYMNIFWSLKHAFSGKDQDFVIELFNVICTHTVHKSNAEICDEAWHKVQCVLGLTSWWLNTQAIKQGAEVRRAMMDIELQRPDARRVAVSPAWSSEDKQQRKRKTLVWLLVDKVISKAIKEASWSGASNSENITTRLLEKTWFEVKDVHFEFTLKCFQLHKAIYADLLKKFGSAQLVLFALQRTDSLIEQEVVSTVAYHLTKAKPKGMMHSFFSFVGEVAGKLFTSE